MAKINPDETLDKVFRFKFLQQFRALFYKNVLVAWRNRRSTLLRLLAPFVFLLLALIVKVALEANDAQTARLQYTSTAKPLPITSIPDCHQDLFIDQKPCIDFLYTPSNDTEINDIISRVRSNNVPPIPENQVLALPTRLAADAYLLANPESCLGAVHFWKKLDGSISFVLQSNTSVKFFKGTIQDPNTFFQIPMLNALQREISRTFLSGAGLVASAALSWTPQLLAFPHPSLETVSVLGYVLGPFIFAAVMFSFVTQLGLLVADKEMGLRQALRNMGMRDSSFWVSWAVYDVLMALVVSILINIFGLILQFRFFLDNDFGVLLMLWWLFQVAMSGFAYFLSTFLKKGQTGVYVGFFIFVIGWIMQTVIAFKVPYEPKYFFDNTVGQAFFWIFSLFPWSPLTKAIIDLTAATNDGISPGLNWDERFSYCQYVPEVSNQEPVDAREVYRDYDCVLSVGDAYIILIVDYFIFLVLAIYLDNVLANENGIKRPFYYLFKPSYWSPRPLAVSHSLTQVLQQQEGGQFMAPSEGELDSDVADEEEKMKSWLNHRTGNDGALAATGSGQNAVELYGLSKRFKAGARAGCCGGRCCGGCCCGERTPAFWAIRGSWFSIGQNQLFCLLGPNGAGKTTTINCLTGVVPYTGGVALINGESIGSEGGLDRVRPTMGVCPQFDVLWPELTGREHLHIYGHVKGIQYSKVSGEAAALLEKVRLTYASGVRTAAYSGGMKRRLSVAIALLGDPKIVYLDEPTTGMDPISRRYVWDIIQEAKAGRAIVLTTHSMEEADILGDRIAIMARGKLRAIGSSIRLKQRFGAGYQISVSVMSPTSGHQDPVKLGQRADEVKRYFLKHLDVKPSEESKAYINFLVERSQEPELIPFLKRLEADSAQLGIVDTQISLTSLEEVFLTIARKAEMDEANRVGRGTVVVHLADGTPLEVPLGQDYHQDASGQYYKIRWAQDEVGNLVVQDATPVDASQLPRSVSHASGLSRMQATPTPTPPTAPALV